ncbi:uncharacterized protein LOC143026727 [Oratosquilla oratoria]|uniref:uncharacterized protein LOC143026727 n=1 Tax=Oratosquilla oratoria TaxID=337810 RepID=UPI003F762401
MEDGFAFQKRPSPETLHQYQLSRDDLVALQRCVQMDPWKNLTDSINHQTSVGTMWHLINKVIKKKHHSALHHSPTQFPQDLVDAWSAQARTSNLPPYIHDALSTHKNYRALRLASALLKTDEEDEEITEQELRRALAKGKATAPGDDGITYVVLRVLLDVPGNPLLQLYNLCYNLGYVPRDWTCSTIVPIPKPGTDKFRPVSLTSCFCKVLERILLSRLMFQIQDKLSPRLYGFLPQRGTHHCLMELYTRLCPTSVVAFIDLKSAFDIANRDIILDQLVDFGIKGILLRWIRGYLRNRNSRVLFKGWYSNTREFELARTLPEFTVGNTIVPLCSQYLYLGAPVRITSSIPARQRVHPIVQDLLTRLQRRLTPLRWLTNNIAGVSIPVARTIYITFIRSVVDYLSPALSQLSKTTLQPLEKFQNQAMRLILGCPTTTRIVNMQQELRLPPIVERIYANVTYFTIKCLHYPHLSPHFCHTIQTSIDLAEPRPQLRPGGCSLVLNISSNIRRLNINILTENEDPGLPPWQTPMPTVTYTPTTKSDLPQLQKQLALETIAGLSSLNAAHHLFTDGSLQEDGSAGCAVYSLNIEPPLGGWAGRRLPNSSSSTCCELHGLLDAVTLLTRTGENGLIICDSQSALRALSSTKPEHQQVVTQIMRQLATTHENSQRVHFLWIPSHIELLGNDTADRLARTACTATTIALLQMDGTISRHFPTRHRGNAERTSSVTIQHHKNVFPLPHAYKRSELLVRRHSVIRARRKPGYRTM